MPSNNQGPRRNQITILLLSAVGALVVAQFVVRSADKRAPISIQSDNVEHVAIRRRDLRMATSDLRLVDPPEGERARKFWVQHAAGLIIFEDARKYAIERIGSNVDEETRKHIVAGIDDAIYGLMMIVDGVTGCLQNEHYAVTLESRVRLRDKRPGADVVATELVLSDGDGMCMGYHGWLEGDYGSAAVAVPRHQNA